MHIKKIVKVVIIFVILLNYHNSTSQDNGNEKLIDNMVPNHYIHMEQMPLTQNLKIDKRSLPDPETKLVEDYVAPSNSIEVKLVEIWAEILKLEPEKISVTNNFFDLGGHSLRAIMVINKIEKEFA